MILGSDRQWVRLAAVGTLAMALGLSACGRKGPLDAPPSVAAPAYAQPAATPGGPVDALGPDGRPVRATVAPPAPPPPQQQRFILDWLLN